MDYSTYPRNNILCIDMRSFYASVEAVKLGLDPMTTMLAVVGDPNRSGSIVLAASPALKKKHGISNVSRYFELPNDPEIHIVKAHMADYINVSMNITRLLNKYAPLEAIHQYSVDEVWVTVNGLEKLFGTPLEIANMIKEDILDNFGITCSIGIGDNKFLAKVVMDLHAKKVGIAECRYEDVQDKLWPFPIEDIWGIGNRMKRNLNRMGIVTLGQIARYDLKSLKKRFGVMGEQLYWHSWGIDLSPVIGNFTQSEQKSFGHGITLLRDYSANEIGTVILDLCEEACRRARESKVAGRTIHLSIGYAREIGGGFSRSITVDYTNVTIDMYKECMNLFHKFYDGHSNIRRVSVSITNLMSVDSIQLNLFEDTAKKNDIGNVMDQIRSKYGSTAILRASSYTDAGITIDRSKKIGGHYA
ncbi:DNA polymerase IV [Virgibacillus salexigens]|uniref:DNA polymerase IV n=1 Tax=Virgibacillus massiliensis TaxID=1462526 RepID=A0A024QHC2_9BACI|nr:DNA polymerase IV [Virgibacillus massiliensis]CDQ41943.1 DNA polymerase IV [Virgibacillus massiliensis]